MGGLEYSGFSCMLAGEGYNCRSSGKINQGVQLWVDVDHSFSALSFSLSQSLEPNVKTTSFFSDSLWKSLMNVQMWMRLNSRKMVPGAL